MGVDNCLEEIIINGMLNHSFHLEWITDLNEPMDYYDNSMSVYVGGDTPST